MIKGLFFMNLAFFDFDGTITYQDSFINFARFAVGRKRFVAGMVFLSPLLAACAFGIVPIWTMKKIFLMTFFRGWDKIRFDRMAAAYAETVIPKTVRPRALERIQWHQDQGDKIVVVSASIDAWLKGWCDQYGLELVCSRLEVKAGRITGKFLHRDCIGQEKVKRIKERYNLDDYQKIYAYGNSRGDRDMLRLADEKYYRWKRII